MLRKIKSLNEALQFNEAMWTATWDRAIAALESGENYEKLVAVADEFARAAAVVRGRIRTLIAEELHA
jgi:hypothetical protein